MSTDCAIALPHIDCLEKLMIKTLLTLSLIVAAPNLVAENHELRVKISASIENVSVMHNNERITIMREQNSTDEVNKDYAQTPRDCPPYCIRPMKISPGVETRRRARSFGLPS